MCRLKRAIYSCHRVRRRGIHPICFCQAYQVEAPFARHGRVGVSTSLRVTASLLVFGGAQKRAQKGRNLPNHGLEPRAVACCTGCDHRYPTSRVSAVHTLTYRYLPSFFHRSGWFDTREGANSSKINCTSSLISRGRVYSSRDTILADT